MKLKIDKEFEKLIPPLQDTEFSGLTKSILKYGCQEPIEIWNNTIIDGHNRYKICKANNIPFEVREMDFSDRSEALVYIIEKQFGRRNLLPFQRSELALKMKNVIQAKAKEKQATSTGGINPQLLQISEKLNQSTPTKNFLSWLECPGIQSARRKRLSWKAMTSKRNGRVLGAKEIP